MSSFVVHVTTVAVSPVATRLYVQPSPGCHSPALLRLCLRRDLHVLREEPSSVQRSQLRRCFLLSYFEQQSRVAVAGSPLKASSGPPVHRHVCLCPSPSSGSQQCRPHDRSHQRVGGGVVLRSAHLFLKNYNDNFASNQHIIHFPLWLNLCMIRTFSSCVLRLMDYQHVCDD